MIEEEVEEEEALRAELVIFEKSDAQFLVSLLDISNLANCETAVVV